MSDYSFNPLQLALKPLFEQAKSEDELFAKEVQEKESRTEKPKSFTECCEYIMGEAYKYAKDHRQSNMGLAGCEDSQIISMIKHYYDEEDIVIEQVSGAKAIVQGVPTKKAETKPTKATKPTKPSKPKKEERPKETLENTHVPMQRPKDEKEAKKESKKQASNVIVMDMFAGMWDDDDAEEETTTEQAEEEIDDLPM